MKILVVDDNFKHLFAAEALDDEHLVTKLDSYSLAMEFLKEGTEVDVLLCDLMMSAEEHMLSREGLAFLGHEIPIGFILMLRAAQVGVKYAAVVTDTNHHNHPISAAIDWINPAYWDGSDEKCMMIANTKTMVAHAPLKDGAKDWAAVLKVLLN